MKQSRLYIPLLFTAAVAYACGPWRHDATPTAQHVSTSHHATQSVASRLGVTVGKTVDFALHVTNNTRKTVELRFPTGHTHDFLVYDAAGKVVWRWSEGRMFTQGMQSRTVRPSDTVSFEDGWDPHGAHGTFTAVAMLASDNHPVEQRAEFVLR